MNFYYKGILRFNGLWDSPTTCGMYMAAFALLSLYMAAGQWERRCLWAAALFFAGCAVFCWLLLITYSRASLVAFCVGLTAFGFVRPRGVWVVPFVLLGVLSLMVPSGISRVNSAADWEEPAVRNRLLLWRSTSELVADHWRTGVHADGYHAVHHAWYLPEKMEGVVYTRPVNAYLYLAAEYGVGPFWVAVWGTVTMLVILFEAAARRRCRVAALLAGCVAIYCLSNFFSIRLSDFYWNAAMIGTLGYSAWLIWRERSSRPTAGRLAAVSGGLVATAALAALLLVGRMERDRRGYEIGRSTVEVSGRGQDYTRLRPRRPSGTTPVVIACMNQGEARDALHLLAGGLAKRGGTAYFVDLSRAEIPAAVEVVAVMIRTAQAETGVKPVVVGLANSVLAVAKAASCETGVAGLVAIDMPLRHALREFSPTMHLEALTCRILSIRSGTQVAGQAGDDERWLHPREPHHVVMAVPDLTHRSKSALLDGVQRWIRSADEAGSGGH